MRLCKSVLNSYVQYNRISIFMSYYEFKSCLHNDIKTIDKYHNMCIKCNEKLCAHPEKYRMTVKPDAKTLEHIIAMPFKIPVLVQSYCIICKNIVHKDVGWYDSY